MQTILGANGTIGTLLAAELPRYTDRIRLVSRNPHRINDTDELLSVDLTLPGSVDRAVKGSDVVYLVVGFDYNIKVWVKRWPALMRDTIDACIRYKSKLVFFDNVYLYDENEIPHMTEASKVNPSSRKGAVRKEISEMLMTAVREGKLNALIARCADYYGTDSSTSLVNQLIFKNLATGRSAMWFMSTSTKHSFTYVPDAAKATAQLGNTADAYGQVWHLPTDPETLTTADFIGMIARELNVKPRVRILPLFIIRTLGLFIPVMKEMPEMVYQYDRDYFFDSSKFLKRFRFRPVSYLEGIKEMSRTYLSFAHRPAA
jgi:nucleoside-diphosphate-sugar epimerase